MPSPPVLIDDQPIAAGFFKQGKWLTDYITPDALEVQELHQAVSAGMKKLEDRMVSSWHWVADQMKYVPFVRAKLWVGGQSSTQDDYWQEPSQAIRTRIGNCVNKSMLLGSLLRNELPADQVYVVLGNLHQPPRPGGHAWVQVILNSQPYIMESTRGDMQPLVPSQVADIYEDILYFNDEFVMAIEDRTLLTPFSAVYADWLRDYLDFAYIEGRK